MGFGQEANPGERSSMSDSLSDFLHIWYCFYYFLIKFFCLKIKSKWHLELWARQTGCSDGWTTHWWVPWELATLKTLKCPVKESRLYAAWSHGGWAWWWGNGGQRQGAGLFLWGWEDLFPKQASWSIHRPQGPHEHHLPVQTSALGLYEGQEILYSHKTILLINFLYNKMKSLWSLPMVVPLTCVHPSEARVLGRSLWRCHVSLGWRGRAVPTPVWACTGASFAFPIGQGRAHGKEWADPLRKTPCTEDKVSKTTSRRQNTFLTWEEPSHLPCPYGPLKTEILSLNVIFDAAVMACQ